MHVCLVGACGILTPMRGAGVRRLHLLFSFARATRCVLTSVEKDVVERAPKSTFDPTAVMKGEGIGSDLS